MFSTVRVVLVYLLFLPLLLSSAATTGSIQVQVVDEGGLEVLRAEVTLSGVALIGGEQRGLTDEDGRVGFHTLPPGRYALRAEHPGLSDSTLSNVLVKVGTENQVVLEMGASMVVRVDREDTIDQGKTSIGATRGRHMIDRLPFGREPLNISGTVAGVRTGAGTGGNFNGGGGARNENTFTIDGVVVTDPVSGTFGENFNRNAIEQMEVLIGGYLPEVAATSLGGVVNIVTQSGSNNLEFGTSVFYTNGNWRPRMDERIGSDGATLSPNGFDDSFSNVSIEAKVAGPIVRDKAFFLVTYSMTRARQGVSGTPQARDFEKHGAFGKVTWQPSAFHRIAAAFSMDPTTVDNQTQGTPFIKGSAQRRQAQGGFLATGRWQWFPTSNITLDTRANVKKIFIDNTSVPCTHERSREHHQCRPGEEEGAFDLRTPGRVGSNGAYASVNTGRVSFDDRWRVGYGSNLAIVDVSDPLGGSHDLKFGVGGEWLSWSNQIGVNGNLQFVDTNATPYDPDSFANSYWLEYSGAQSLRTTGSRVNFFLQDSWRPISNLTVNLGTRYDHASMRNDIGEAVVQGGAFGPRLHLSWDPTRDGKTKIATGYGRFNDMGRLGVADFTSQSGFGSKLFVGENLSGGDSGGQGHLNGSSVNYSYDPTRNLNIAHDSLATPHTDEVVLLVERELVRDVAISSQMAGRFTRNLFEVDDVSTIYGGSGLEVIGSRFGDSDTPRYRVRTPKLAKRDTFLWVLSARKVWASRWSAEVTYSFSQALASSTNSFSGSFVNDAQTQFNYGPSFNDQNHVLRGLLVWDLPTDPWTQQLGLYFVGASGSPVERFYYGGNPDGDGFDKRIGDRSAYARLQPYWDLSLKFTQQVPVRKGNFALTFEAQNLTNNRAAGLVDRSQLATQNRYVFFSRQQPLTLEAGANYTF